jgi:hypothetical protein
MENPILVTGAAGRIGAVGRTVTELLLSQAEQFEQRCALRTSARRHCALWVRKS